MCVQVDLGRAFLSDVNGSTLAEFERSGVVKGNMGSTCGYVEGFHYDKLKTVSVYILFFDRQYIAESYASF